jgi:hypothetical protein
MKKRFFGLLAAALLTVCHPAGAAAYSPPISPFPIGIFWPPGPSETTDARYAEIANMNANLIIGSNNISTPALNDIALFHAYNNGLRLIVDDRRFVWRDFLLDQTSTGFGFNVSTASSIGQTFTAPLGSGIALNTIELFIDKDNWPAGVTLTLSLYTSPAKTTLLATDSITGPPDTYFPNFRVYKYLTPGASYYFELTSDSATPVGWVVTSNADVYAGGQSYINGTPHGGFDLWFRMPFSQKVHEDGGAPDIADIDAIAAYYGGKNGLQGYHLYDEPSVHEMTRLQQTSERLKLGDPNHMSFVNLFPTYASAAQLGVDQFSGEFVNVSQRLGQTFRTKSWQTSIDTVQLWIDNGTWGSGEALTLSLWDSPSKTNLIAQHTISSKPANNWPQFHLSASVSPNTDYYMELTHNGGGDGQIGWVVRSHTNSDWYLHGTGYVNGAPIAADFWFTVNQNIQGGTYEDYVYRWTQTNPDVLVFDHYPFLVGGGMTNSYYTNLEIIRRQALAARIDFWAYIQAVGINGYYRTPSQSDMRYQIYTNLAYGAKGYIYFTYWTPASSGGETFENGLLLPDGTRNVSYDWAKDLNAEVLNLGPTLMSLTSEAVYHSGGLPEPTVTALPSGFFWQPTDASAPLVIGYFKNASGRKYVMVVNRSVTQPRTVTFQLGPSKPSDVKEISKTTGAEVSTDYNASTGTLTVSFLPGEGRLFALPLGY